MRAFLCLFVKRRTSDHKHLRLFWSKTVLFSLLSGWFTLTSSNKLNVIMYLKHSVKPTHDFAVFTKHIFNVFRQKKY